MAMAEAAPRGDVVSRWVSTALTTNACGVATRRTGWLIRRFVDLTPTPGMAESDGARFLSATLENLPPNSVFEPGRSEAAGAGEVTAVAVDDHRQRGDPGAGAERLLRGVERRRPDALE